MTWLLLGSVHHLFTLSVVSFYIDIMIHQIKKNIKENRIYNIHTQTHTQSLLIGTGFCIADNHRHFISIKHRGDAPFAHCDPQENDWQWLVRSQTLKCDSAITEFKGAAGPDGSEGYKAPLNFTFCLDPIYLTDISECDPYLMSV